MSQFKRTKTVPQPKLSSDEKVKKIEKFDAEIDALLASQKSTKGQEAELLDTNKIDPEAADIIKKMSGVRLVKDNTAAEETTEDRVLTFEETINQEINKDNFYNAGYAEHFNRLPFTRRLELLNLTKEKLAEITDSLILHGFYEQKIDIRCKLTVCLRTREAEINMRVLDLIKSPDLTNVKMLELLSLYNCAGSLKQYGTNFWSPLADIKEDEKDDYLKSKVNFLKALPSPLYGYLSYLTVMFDMTINTASSPEGIQNF